MASVSYIKADKLVDLLRSACSNKEMFVRVLSSTKLALGQDALSPSIIIDLSKENMYPHRPDEFSALVEVVPEKRVVEQSIPLDALQGGRGTRRGGYCKLEFKGKVLEFQSQKELLSKSLILLESSHAGTLESLSSIKPRTRRIVAKDRKLLFDNQNLVADHSERLIGDWWYGTNNSADQTLSWLQRACDCAGLVWGKEFRITFS
jgi:hypothetical protein